MLFLLATFLTIFVLYILRFYYDLIHAFFVSLKINGPPALPIIGNGLLFINNTSAGILQRGKMKKISFFSIVNFPGNVTKSVWLTVKDVLFWHFQ